MQNAGDNLRSAVEKSKNPALRTRLNTCISPTDVHAIDVHYHKICWRSNVFYVTREMPSNTSSSQVHPLQIAFLVEISLVGVNKDKRPTSSWMMLKEYTETCLRML